jgi:hypothetical protein
VDSVYCAVVRRVLYCQLRCAVPDDSLGSLDCMALFGACGEPGKAGAKVQKTQ